MFENWKVNVEAQWPIRFGERLTYLIAATNLSVESVAEAIESTPERIRELMEGKSFPTIPEILRLSRLSYGGPDYLFGVR